MELARAFASIALLLAPVWAQDAESQFRSLHVRQFGAVGDGAADDTEAFEKAIAAARFARTRMRPLHFSGGVYNISRTLTIQNAEAFTFDGGGSVLRWTGETGVPMLLIRDVRNSTFQSFEIRSSSQFPLATAIRSENGPEREVVPTSNRFQSVVIEGTNRGGLDKGFQFALGEGGDNNNDLNSFYDCYVRNYQSAAWSFEHSQSVAHMLIRSGFSGNRFGRYGVTTGLTPSGNGGSFSVIDGVGGGNTEADFFIGAPNRPMRIQGFDSENSVRFLITGGGSSSMPLRIESIKFADNQINSEREAIVYSFPGPLEVSNSHFGTGSLGPVYIVVDAKGSQATYSVHDNAFNNQDSGLFPPVICRQCDLAQVNERNNLQRLENRPFLRGAN